MEGNQKYYYPAEGGTARDLHMANCSFSWPESVLSSAVFLFKINIIYKHLSFTKLTKSYIIHSFLNKYLFLKGFAVSLLSKIHSSITISEVSPCDYKFFLKPQIWHQAQNALNIMKLGNMYIFYIF